MVSRDARFKLVDGYNLQIGSVRIQDAGDYVCQIGDQEARDQVHTVEILVPPSVRPVPQNGQITARKGSTVTLECKASGNPVPNLYWHKKVRKSVFLCFVSHSPTDIKLCNDTTSDRTTLLLKIQIQFEFTFKLTMFLQPENYRLHSVLDSI